MSQAQGLKVSNTNWHNFRLVNGKQAATLLRTLVFWQMICVSAEKPKKKNDEENREEKQKFLTKITT